MRDPSLDQNGRPPKTSGLSGGLDAVLQWDVSNVIPVTFDWSFRRDFSLVPFISLSLSLSLSPHHSFVSFHVGNNARFNAKSIDDERAFIRFIRFAKIIQNRFFDDEGVEIRWFVGVVIIDCRYIVDILIYFWVRNIV